MPKKRKDETSHKETAFGIIPRSELIPMEIEGVKRAWDFIFGQHSRGKIPITPCSLQQVHRIGFGWIFPKSGGCFRTIEVKVSNHEPPSFYKVPILMEEFTRDLKVRLKHLSSLEDIHFLDDLIDLLGWAHHRFLWIHPFIDYNGRIGRLLINMILLNLDLPPIEMRVETQKGRKQYVEALRKADQGDLNSLKRLIRAALKEVARDLR